VFTWIQNMNRCLPVVVLLSLIVLVQGIVVVDDNNDHRDMNRVESSAEMNDVRRLQPNIRLAGNNGFPLTAFPLGVCEGDCDQDSDCAGDLRCFQRSNGHLVVPGCAGGAADVSHFDYCYDPSFVLPRIANETFLVKLYWKHGYHWQEERFERRWCWRCSADCEAGDHVKVVNCDNDGGVGFPNRFRFLPQIGGDAQIQEVSSGFCLQRTHVRQLTLQRCQPKLVRQRFMPMKGAFDFDDRFEINAVERPGYCVTQGHHPKSGELLKLQQCKFPEAADTSYWSLEAPGKDGNL
jgi:hypothetical protein